VKIYGIYIGYDCVTVSVRNTETRAVVPLIIRPLNKKGSRYDQVATAFGEIRRQRKLLRVKNPSVASLSFESPENLNFMTSAAKESPDMTEMMSWEMFMRTGEAVRDYHLSSCCIKNDLYFVAAAKIKDMEFYTKQVARLGLKVVAVRPSITAVLNIFEMNYKVADHSLIAFLSRERMTTAYVEKGKLTDVREYARHHNQEITAQDIMRARAELSETYTIADGAVIYITGDLLADKKRGKEICNQMHDCLVLDPFKRVAPDTSSDKDLLSAHSFAFGASVSLSMEKL